MLVGALTGLLGGAAGLGSLVLQARSQRAQTSGLKVGRPSTAAMMNRYGTEYLDTFITASNPTSIPNALVNVVLECRKLDGSFRSFHAELGLTDEAVTQPLPRGAITTTRFRVEPGAANTFMLIFNRPSREDLIDPRLNWEIVFRDARGRKGTRTLAVTDPETGLLVPRERPLFPIVVGRLRRRGRGALRLVRRAAYASMARIRRPRRTDSA